MSTSTTPRRARSTKAALPTKTANGAVSTASTVAEVVCPAAPRRNVNNATGRQTHGALTSMSGPITSVSQLTNGGRSVAKGSVGSFETLGDYTSYLRTLATHELHRHAVAEARIVPIDDRERLIRRLETAWTAASAKYPGHTAAVIPSRQPFTKEQIEAQAAIKSKLLRQ